MILVVDSSVLKHASDANVQGREVCLECLYAIVNNSNISIQQHAYWTDEFFNQAPSVEVMEWKTAMRNARRFVKSERGTMHPGISSLEVELKRHPKIYLLTMAYLANNVVIYCATYESGCKELAEIDLPVFTDIIWKEVHSTSDINTWLETCS